MGVEARRSHSNEHDCLRESVNGPLRADLRRSLEDVLATVS